MSDTRVTPDPRHSHCGHPSVVEFRRRDLADAVVERQAALADFAGLHVSDVYPLADAWAWRICAECSPPDRDQTRLGKTFPR